MSAFPMSGPWVRIDEDRNLRNPPTKEDVERLISSADTLFERDRVYCHCFAGVSRSSACAFVLKCMLSGIEGCDGYLGEFYRSRDIIRPHVGIVGYADQLLGADGQMAEALDKFLKKTYGEQ